MTSPAASRSESVGAPARSLKVLMVAPTSFFNDYGGHIRILEEARSIQRAGLQVRIVTYYMGNEVSGLRIQRTPRLPYHADYEVGSSRHKLAFDAFLFAKVLQVGLRFVPDIVHGHMHEGALIGGALARLIRKPLVFDFQGGLTAEMVDHGFLNPRGRAYSWARRLERFICRLPNVTITSSLRAKELLAEEFGVAADRIRALPDCVDTERFDPGKFSAVQKEVLRRKLGIPSGRTVVVYLGLLADYQGTPHLIHAARILGEMGEDVHFLIMGYPRVDQYRAMADELKVKDRVTFTGKVPYTEAPFYLSLGDIAVSAKMSATEGSGKVLNYMAMEQPVVAFDSPVHREYLGEQGEYAEVGSARSLAMAIARLAHGADRRRCLGKKLRERAVVSYSWHRAGEQIVELYQELTKR